MNPPSWEMIIGLCAFGTAIGGILVGAIKLGSILRRVEENEEGRDTANARITGLERIVWEMRGAQKAKHGEDTTP